jgi:hypothetical protein
MDLTIFCNQSEEEFALKPLIAKPWQQSSIHHF